MNKSRYKKFRGREYIADTKAFLGEDKWNHMVEVIKDVSSHDLFPEIKVRRAIKFMMECEVHSVTQATYYAGVAWIEYPRVDVHWSLLEEIDKAKAAHKWDTIWHELAHILTDHLFNERAHHGAKWRWVFGKLIKGQKVERCHNLGYLPSKYKQVRKVAKGPVKGQFPIIIRMTRSSMYDLRHSEEGSYEDYENEGRTDFHIYPVYCRHSTILELRTQHEVDECFESIRWSIFSSYAPGAHRRLEDMLYKIKS